MAHNTESGQEKVGSGMLKRLDNYDWEEVFKYANQVQVVINGKCADTPFDRNSVKKILHIEDGENDEQDWIGIFQLRDGRYAFITAGCDYTGWG